MIDLKNMTREQLQARLNALLQEREECKAKIATAEVAQLRLEELNDRWQTRGEISCAKFALRDSEFPVFSGRGWLTRIIAVDDSWITLREDGHDLTVQYRRDTGQKKGTRSEWQRIDAAKALEIWANHTASKVAK